MQSMLCDIILMQCFTPFITHICINTNFTLLASSSSTSTTQMDTTSDIIVKSTKTGDTTSGKQNLLTNFAKNLCMAKYPY